MPKVKPIPEGMTAVTPHLVCANALEAIEFYKKAFGAVEESKMPGPDGRLMHGSIRIGGACIMLMEEMPEWGALGPKTLKGSPVTIHIYTEDADALVARAVKAGATVKMPVDDAFWGDRYGTIEDPYGHQWSIATHTRDLSPAEIEQGMKEMAKDMAKA